MIIPLVLISCVGAKAAAASPASDMYTSEWFKKARRYAEGRTAYGLGGDWAILSALHGVLSPDSVVEPYEKTLNALPKAERQAWAARVLGQLEARYVLRNRAVVFLAEEKYREFLVPALRPLMASVSIPLEGLGIGQQLAWFNAQRKGTDNL